VNPRDAVRALAFGRIAIGVALVLFPRLVGRLMLGEGADNAAASVAGRALGIRDAVLGGMLLHTVDHPEVGRRWIATCGAVDAVDAFAAWRAGDEIPTGKRRVFLFIAGGSAIDHLVLSRLITSPAGLESVAAQTPPQPASSPETAYPDGSQEAMRRMGARPGV
jgi:hypothetical protein